MKWVRLLLPLVLLLLPITALAKDGMSVWMTGDYNVLGVRAGANIGNAEIGGLSEWRPWEEEDVPQVFGIYAAYHLPQEIPLGELPLFSFVPPDVTAASYIGVKVGVEINDDDTDRGFYGPMLGVVFNKFILDEVDDQITTGIEYSFVNYTDDLERAVDRNDESRITFFLKIDF